MCENNEMGMFVTAFTGVLEVNTGKFTCVNAGELKIPLQFHTGLQEGNGNILSNSNPEQLNHLLIDFPVASFLLYHIAFESH